MGSNLRPRDRESHAFLTEPDSAQYMQFLFKKKKSLLEVQVKQFKFKIIASLT